MELKVVDVETGLTSAPQLRRYGIAVVAVGLAIVARLLLHPILGDRLQLATLCAAVALVAWYVGKGPAITTLLLGLAGLVFLIIEPRYSLDIVQRVDMLTVLFYAGIGAGLIALIEQLREALRAADANTALVRQSEADLADLFENATIGLHWVGPNGEILRANRAELDMLGYTRDEYVGRSITEFHEDQALIADMLTRLMRGEQLREQPARLRCKDGSIRDVLIDSSAMVRDGRFIHTRCFTRDVTERKRMELIKRENDERFRKLADAMPQIVWVAGTNGQVDYLNRRWNEYTGLPVTIGNPGWTQVMHTDDAPLARERWAQSLQDGRSFEMEIRLLEQRSQSYRWHLMRTVAVKDDEGVITRWFGTATDIHEQKRAEESSRFLAEASAMLAGVQDYESTLQQVANLAVPYFADWSAVDMARPDGTLRRLAVAHREADKIAFVQRLADEYPQDPNAATGAYGVLRSRQPLIIEAIPDDMLVKSARDARHLALIRSLGLRSYICVPLIVSGDAMGVFTFATAESGRSYGHADLTVAVNLANRASVAIENARLYAALRESDRRKDVFLATLAHELRNPLAPLANMLHVLKSPDVNPKAVAQSRAMMERQVHQLVRLVDDLLDVSRVSAGKIELHRKPIDLASAIALAVETVRPLLDAKGHALELKLPDAALTVDADAVRLGQVIGNILTNAAKYSAPRSSITLNAAREDGMAVVRIRDYGVGIDASMLERIFQLFVQADQATTKAHGGLGVGLTLARNLVEMHGGSIEAHSEGLGKGSEFVVRLPLARNADAHLDGARAADDGTVSSSAAPLARAAVQLRLLVVDDNEDAATSLAALLSLQGHDVHVENSGPAALALPDDFTADVAFLDIGMPGMDGFELARRLRQRAGLE
ncbi:MAG TPA: PAS domain S-box protein, partial [Pseudomonadales bacterium]